MTSDLTPKQARAAAVAYDKAFWLAYTAAVRKAPSNRTGITKRDASAAGRAGCVAGIAAAAKAVRHPLAKHLTEEQLEVAAGAFLAAYHPTCSAALIAMQDEDGKTVGVHGGEEDVARVAGVCAALHALDQVPARRDSETADGISEIERLAATFGGKTDVDQLAILLMRAWGKADPRSTVTRHPAAYVSTFADMARAALSQLVRPDLTERQTAAWPEAVAQAQQHVGGTISTDPDSLDWQITFDPESRPGRGHMIRAVWCNGEHLVEIGMDVYGYPRVSVAETNWLHNSSDEECGCEPCEREREDD